MTALPLSVNSPGDITAKSNGRHPAVLHVLAPAREGGLEAVVTMLSAGQGADRAHVAAVITPDQSPKTHPFVCGLAAIGVPVTPLVVGSRSYLAEYQQLAALVSRIKPALLHTHGYRADIIGGLVARSCGLPAVSTVHGFTGGSRRNRLNEHLQCVALRYADGVIAVSKPLVHKLSAAGIPQSRIHFVQNGFAPLSDTLSRKKARHRLGIPDDRLVAAWIGRLSAEKGPDVALDSLSHCGEQWHVSMIGDGREASQLRERAVSLGVVDRVTWHGPLPNAGSLLPAFDALILTSRTEGTPIVVFEAMAAGVPIVATKVGGVPDVLTSADAILVPPDMPHAIAWGLDEIARDQKAADRRAAHSRQRLGESFAEHTWLARVAAVYERVLNDAFRCSARRAREEHVG